MATEISIGTIGEDNQFVETGRKTKVVRSSLEEWLMPFWPSEIGNIILKKGARIRGEVLCLAGMTGPYDFGEIGSIRDEKKGQTEIELGQPVMSIGRGAKISPERMLRGGRCTLVEEVMPEVILIDSDGVKALRVRRAKS